MKLLLDTHALLWYLEGSASLGERARSAMEDVENECYVSHATAWEIAIKTSLGKLELGVPFDALFPDALDSNQMQVLPLRLEHFLPSCAYQCSIGTRLIDC